MRIVKNIVGQKFGKLTVIQYIGINDGGLATWECQCDCGNKKVVAGTFLKRSVVKSCGCLLFEKEPKNKLPNGQGLKNKVYNEQARYRDYLFELTKEQFFSIVNNHCNYCGNEPSNFVSDKHNNRFYYNGIDRIDNNIGYTLENCVAACKICNRAKRDLSTQEFNSWISRIINYNE
jgi:hypothetical protein